MTDKSFYKVAADEVTAGHLDEALWIKVCADMPGAGRLSQQAKYIQLRAQELAVEAAKRKAHVLAHTAKWKAKKFVKEAIIFCFLFAILACTFVLINMGKLPPRVSAPMVPQVTMPNGRALRAKPANVTDMQGWHAYLSQVAHAHMDGVQNTPYMYFVPAGDDSAAVAARSHVQNILNGVVTVTLLPGNMICVGGPDSSKTADVIVAAFKNVRPGSFDGVVVLFIGDPADRQRVEDAVSSSRAEFRFASML